MNDIVHELDMGLVQIILYNFCERMTNYVQTTSRGGGGLRALVTL